MMEAVAIPPFEHVYEAHAGEVLGYLTRMLGRQAAEDAWQETFLRALRAYPQLRHGRHLRAWVFTIATRVALDERRRAKPVPGELPELPVADAPLRLRGARALDGRAAADRAGRRRAPLRLRPRLRGDRRRARLERGAPPARPPRPASAG